MSSKEEILSELCKKYREGEADFIPASDFHASMDQFAKQEAIAFAEWMAENVLDSFCDGVWQWLVKGEPMPVTAEQLYTLFTKRTGVTHWNPHL